MGTGSGEGISTSFLSPVFDTAGGNGKRLGSEELSAFSSFLCADSTYGVVTGWKMVPDTKVMYNH